MSSFVFVVTLQGTIHLPGSTQRVSQGLTRECGLRMYITALPGLHFTPSLLVSYAVSGLLPPGMTSLAMPLLSALEQLSVPIHDAQFTSSHTDRRIMDGWCAGDWRQLYELAQQALQDKAAGLGKRLRAMTQAEVQSRQTRNVEVRQVI